MFRTTLMILGLMGAQAFAIPKYHPGIACVLSATNANLAEASYNVEVHGTSDDILKPESVSVRVERIGDDFKIRIKPHYEMDYDPQTLEFRVPNKMMVTREGGGVQQPTFRLVHSGFKSGTYFETRITDRNKENWPEAQMDYVFEYRVAMRSPIEVGSVVYMISDKHGKIIESATWDFLEELTLQ